MIRTFLLSLAVCLLLPTSSLLAEDHGTGGVHEYQLKNGLKILVKEDHRAPVVASEIWYRVGSSYEPGGLTGISHVLEHMMFKGTKKYGPGEFSKIISSLGGRENAFTSYDYTGYFQLLERSHLQTSFKLEADRMRNLLLDQEEFKKEIEVVKEERRLRTEDNPSALTYERFVAAAYVSSPYQQPIIGWMDDLNHLKLEDIEDWYDQWYAPNNATLVVVGDVQPEQVLKLAKKYFGRIKARELPAIKPQREVTPLGERRIQVRVPAKVPILMMGYQVPVLTTAKVEWEPYALTVLAAVLDGGASARFAKELIRGQQIAASAGAGYNMAARMDSLFMFDAVPAPGKTVVEVEEAILKQIAQLKSESVSAAELARIKAQVRAEDVYQQDSIYYQARLLGSLDSVGLDYRLIDSYADRIEQVTAEQVRQVAVKYLVPDRLTTAVLQPIKLDAETKTKEKS